MKDDSDMMMGSENKSWDWLNSLIGHGQFPGLMVILNCSEWVMVEILFIAKCDTVEGMKLSRWVVSLEFLVPGFLLFVVIPSNWGFNEFLVTINSVILWNEF